MCVGGGDTHVSVSVYACSCTMLEGKVSRLTMAGSSRIVTDLGRDRKREGKGRGELHVHN